MEWDMVLMVNVAWGGRGGTWCGGFSISAARFSRTYCFAFEQDSRSCAPHKRRRGEGTVLVLFQALFTFIKDRVENFVNQYPTTLLIQSTFQGKIFFPFNQNIKLLFPFSLLQVAWKQKQGPPCCYSVILNCRGQSPLFQRMVLTLEWAEVQCLASLLAHWKISLTCLSSWNTFNRAFWKSCSHKAVLLLLPASACYQTNTLYELTGPCNLAVFLRIAPFSSALWKSLIFPRNKETWWWT